MRYGVIGAGALGLTVAVRLAEQGHQVTVLERDPVPGGLSKAQAYAAARAAYPDATGAVSGKAGQMRDFDTNQQVVPGDQWVWAVVVSGTFPFSCGPAPLPGQTHPPCPPPGTTMTVILDYKTGTFLEALGQSGR